MSLDDIKARIRADLDRIAAGEDPVGWVDFGGPDLDQIKAKIAEAERLANLDRYGAAFGVARVMLRMLVAEVERLRVGLDAYRSRFG